MRTAVLLLWIIVTASAFDATPGPHRRVPCDGGGGQTLDLFIPKAYDGKVALPVVFLSAPRGTPGFAGLENWAETHQCFLAAINNSRNGPTEPIVEAQQAVLSTLSNHVKLHDHLRFHIGGSGAAQAGWLLASRQGKQFSGLVMVGQGGFPEVALMNHIDVYYISGREDHNLPLIKEVGSMLLSRGHRVRTVLKDGGHVGAGRDEMILALEWMFHYRSLSHPSLTQPAKRQRAAEILAFATTQPAGMASDLWLEETDRWMKAVVQTEPAGISTLAEAIGSARLPLAQQALQEGKEDQAITLLHTVCFAPEMAKLRSRPAIIQAWVEARTVQLNRHSRSPALRDRAGRPASPRAVGCRAGCPGSALP